MRRGVRLVSLAELAAEDFQAFDGAVGEAGEAEADDEAEDGGDEGKDEGEGDPGDFDVPIACHQPWEGGGDGDCAEECAEGPDGAVPPWVCGFEKEEAEGAPGDAAGGGAGDGGEGRPEVFAAE